MQQEKWQQIRNKKGYLKIHICSSKYKNQRNTRFFRSYRREIIYDVRKVMPKLIEHFLENNNDIKIKSVLGDGSYDGNENFNYLQKNNIKPTAIKVRKNSIISQKNNNGLRNKEKSVLS